MEVFRVLPLMMLIGTSHAATTKGCKLRCPSGWLSIDGSGSDHCYLMPSAPILQAGFWTWQEYCTSVQPTSYLVEPTSLKEFGAIGMKALAYFAPYLISSYYLWIGAYFENGKFNWLNGETWDWNAVTYDVTNMPKNGSCVIFDPRKKAVAWYYQDCANMNGASICEMSPLPDCSGATVAMTTVQYTGGTCDTPRTVDYVEQAQRGYVLVEELLTLTGMDAISCGVACMYYMGCYSYDIGTNGECRLLDANNQFGCVTFKADNEYQHFDMLF